jgi:DNA-binding protein HU-beta
MEKMNYATFVKELSNKTGFSQKDIKEVLSSTEELMKGLMKDGTQVKVFPSVTFYKGVRAGRTGHNPKTGDAVEIPAKNVCKVKFSASFKEALQ